jgi:hypothetical protein
VSDHKGTPGHEAEVVKEPGGGILRKGSIEVFRCDARRASEDTGPHDENEMRCGRES